MGDDGFKLISAFKQEKRYERLVQALMYVMEVDARLSTFTKSGKIPDAGYLFERVTSIGIEARHALRAVGVLDENYKLVGD